MKKRPNLVIPDDVRWCEFINNRRFSASWAVVAGVVEVNEKPVFMLDAQLNKHHHSRYNDVVDSFFQVLLYDGERYMCVSVTDQGSRLLAHRMPCLFSVEVKKALDDAVSNM